MKFITLAFHIYLIAGLFLMIISGAVVMYWLVVPEKTIVINNYSEGNPIPVLDDTVHPGEQLSYMVDFCKYRNDVPVIKRWMIDGQIIEISPTGGGSLPEGCHKAVVRSAIIPTTVNPGKYYLKVEVTYRINPLRTQTTSYQTGYFTVLPSTGKAEKNLQDITIIKPSP